MISITSNTRIAIIVEGATERAIIELLLENGCLKFSASQVINYDSIDGLDSPYRGPNRFYGKPATFSNHYLTQDYEENKVIVFIIEDRSGIPYKISQPFLDKLQDGGIYHVVTKSEIEMIEIYFRNLERGFEKVKSQTKPSTFLSQHLNKKINDIKSYSRIKMDLNPYGDLVNAIKKYKSKSDTKKWDKKNNEIFLADLLK
ncbi:hypothetical protein [Streptococcus sp. DD11]|uniref:hypothetical protein n=1 Tax=Streptococcus sp. DD11 TaxID=1777879 RepID=UPI000AC00647|nr:hypothetical protein [Streptococcus sp. DD11]